MASSNAAAVPEGAAIQMLVPLAHVADVDRSIEFYGLLGFQVGDKLANEDGKTHWAALQSADADLMLAQADVPVVGSQQAILFYLYTEDLVGLRNHLLVAGVPDAGSFSGCPMPVEGRGRIFSITFPDYMPEGECRIEDPDGYCLLVGQLE